MTNDRFSTTKSLTSLWILVPLLALGVVGCDGSPAAPSSATLDEHHAHAARAPQAAPVRDDSALLKAVRSRTARFNSMTQTERAGYHVEEFCVAIPGVGAMGHHAVNMPLVDPVFDPMQPEALLFAPNESGTLKLVGVEYIVINMGQDAPEFDGHPFDVGGVPPLMDAKVPHWSLHVWAHAQNPAGTFVPFNPAVSCD